MTTRKTETDSPTRTTTPRALLAAVLMLLACVAAPGRGQADELTFDANYYYYEEPGVMHEASDPAFFSLGARRWDGYYEALRFLYTAEASGGPTHYKGSGELDGVYYKLRAEIYGGYRFRKLMPILGFGYRWLYDNSGGQLTTTNAASYDRQSQYFYIPIGLVYDATDKFKIKAQYNVFLLGIQNSYLSDVAGYYDIENEQKSGWGVDVAATYRLNATWGIYGFARYWDIADSDTTVDPNNVSWIEPANNTTEVGLGVSYRF